MNRVALFMGIFLLSRSACLAEDCAKPERWENARSDCLKQMSKEDDCFWNCVMKVLDNLDDSGRMSAEKLHNGLSKWGNDKSLLEMFERKHATCLSKLDDTMDDCKATKVFHECVLKDPELQQALIGPICEPDRIKLLEGV